MPEHSRSLRAHEEGTFRCAEQSVDGVTGQAWVLRPAPTAVRGAIDPSAHAGSSIERSTDVAAGGYGHAGIRELGRRVEAGPGHATVGRSVDHVAGGRVERRSGRVNVDDVECDSGISLLPARAVVSGTKQIRGCELHAQEQVAIGIGLHAAGERG